MTTAAERKARREAQIQKEFERKMIRGWIRGALKCIGAYIGFIAAAYWLGIVMYENPEWAFTISWITLSLAAGAALFYKAAK